MKIKERKEKEKNNIDDYDNDLCLHYIKIDNKNKIEEIEEDDINRKLMELVNSTYVDKDNEVGEEINKCFYNFLPDNKDGDVLKANFSLSQKIIEGVGKEQIKKLHAEYMTTIMNSKINTEFVLTKDINEKLAVILSEIYHKIKKAKKINENEELMKHIMEKNFSGILELYKDKKENNKHLSFIVENPDDNNNSVLLSREGNRISRVINNSNALNRTVLFDDSACNRYCFREIKNILQIPLEILILRERFENIKKLKLILKGNININNDLLLLDQKDKMNNNFILFNIQWLFPHLLEIELDLTNEYILKDEILSINNKYNQFLKKTKKNKVRTNLQSEYKKRVYDIHKKTVFNENNKFDDFEIVSGSFSIVSSVKENKDEEIKKQENFIKKYMSSLEMIIIYWYFISNLKNITNINCTIPMNLEDKIIYMLKEKKIYLFEFNLLSNIKSDTLLNITLDFNSLDNKMFSQILSFLVKCQKMRSCHLSFFPPEEYFDPHFLLNLLLSSDKMKNEHYIKDIRIDESIDVFLLRKLSEFFEMNMMTFFVYFINNTKLIELSLIFDIPGILNKIDNYELIIIKLILNLLIHIDKTSNTMISLNSLSIIADNLSFDNRKNPFLNHFFENINIFRRKDLNFKKLTFKVKMSKIPNIYRIIPYHVTYLSIGSFDMETLEYFVEYITSIEFNTHSEIKSLQITLGNTIINIEECFDLLEKLLVESPRTLEEIYIYTNLVTNYTYIKKLLEKTNYNRIENIFIQFNEKSLEDKDLKKKYGKNIKLQDNKDKNFMDLYYVKRDEIKKQKILKIMYNIGKKYNPNFMDYYIFLEIEKFLGEKDKKKNIIQYK